MSGSRTRKFSGEEKSQVLANLDLEVAHKTRQFEDWLADTLENFRRHQESLILRMPRAVRGVTMRDFARFGGDVQAALKGLMREQLGTEDATIDMGTRKRKWVESQEAEEKAAKEGDARKAKAARTVAATPKKSTSQSAAPAFGTAQKSRLPITKTPAKTRTASRVPSNAVSPSPQKGTSKPLPYPRTPSRFQSPSRPSNRTGTAPGSRVPSSSTFNPVIPGEAAHPRWPRQNEHMLSVNGSPLANPYELDLNNWFSAIVNGDEPEGGARGDTSKKTAGARTLKTQRSILIRTASGSSSLQAGSSSFGSHSRSTSRASTLVGSQSESSQPKDGGARKGSIASEQTADDPFAAPPVFAALVSVQTKDGHVLEFNPLQTSPEELDALEGITDSAKKQAKVDMGRMVQMAVERWKLS
ncbi:uncharacterized protein BXZ73DRAFT_50616 [Epithele typhae]|uniref:uncharacterized protein n=1 Tax=Epithele typhae TaxID=378194 RepID=UPI0020080603|nr:uncharacterized protein BXZ73DRAFT_50616 [Epithele typhae]KAH9924260.1 hypothetical protein BXZ73DRAFT_50616 [Epithele typhae]